VVVNSERPTWLIEKTDILIQHSNF